MHRFSKKIAKTYNERFKDFGPVPEASLWFSKERQITRFQILTDQLLNCHLTHPAHIGDIGCGYGEYFRYLNLEHPSSFEHYYGYDIAANLIDYCKANLVSKKASFFVDQVPKFDLDITVMSGTFNLSATKELISWKSYVHSMLKSIWKKTRIAMIFNLQVKHQSEITEDRIVYFQVEEITSLCEEYFGPTKVIYHPRLQNDATFLVQKL